ncbi:phosphotransferase family protein [Nocardioides albidus]|uniref:Phosphotransferase family protein n=1 Tax=Nocardioides albidus TaxID=1517589 RepID=A0A5C4VLJ8_9ACTN|nr:phosphotransferase family protein [Nocardioides albidus]TNM36718.1 phosphotransferase family protein [Nocardioides albidus]
MTTAVPGLDIDRLSGWLSQQGLGSGAPLEATVIAGGKSNLTYVLSDGTDEWIVRRPPLGHVLATAHDMGREYRVLTALRDTAVPVPRTYAFCADVEVVGAPFYVMERCAGTPYRNASELESLGVETTRVISTRLVDTLADLHGVDPEAVGLGDFGRAQGYLARQVSRWKKQLDASHSRDLPAADELYARLAGDIPEESGAAIVHGDYRLDNVLFEGERMTAVLDWEMATLGDPLADLAVMLTYHRLGALPGGATTSDVPTAPGFLTEREVIERYAERSGRDMTRFGFYLGLSAFKLAAILEGIHYRHIHGQTVGEGFDKVGDSIHPLLDAGLDAMKENH